MEELCVPSPQKLQCKHNGLAVSENLQDRLTGTYYITYIYGYDKPILISLREKRIKGAIYTLIFKKYYLSGAAGKFY